MQGSRFLRLDSNRIMTLAEKLYNNGWISYPRTETDQFPPGFDLHGLIRKQTQDGTWGAYASSLLDNNGFNQPRSGRHNDQAHPPIHPVNYINPSTLSLDERKVYEFIVRRFLASCSADARGESTDIELLYGPAEVFTAHGLRVIERNYLDIYVYDKWESSQPLPEFRVGETFEPTEAMMHEGKTTPPGYLTEPELIGLMDANGIGTDATMAEHIAKIKDREYVATRRRAGGPQGQGGGPPNTGVEEFIPTRLGAGLISGYESIDFPDEDIKLSKPFLRKEMEVQMKGICEGRVSRGQVVSGELERWREVFVISQGRFGVVREKVREFLGAELD